MDLSGLNINDTRKLTELLRAKESVQLPDKFGMRNKKTRETDGSLQEIDEFNEIWGKAGNN